jgi:hypothetical protein
MADKKSIVALCLAKWRLNSEPAVHQHIAVRDGWWMPAGSSLSAADSRASQQRDYGLGNL